MTAQTLIGSTRRIRLLAVLPAVVLTASCTAFAESADVSNAAHEACDDLIDVLAIPIGDDASTSARGTIRSAAELSRAAGVLEVTEQGYEDVADVLRDLEGAYVDFADATDGGLRRAELDQLVELMGELDDEARDADLESCRPTAQLADGASMPTASDEDPPPPEESSDIEVAPPSSLPPTTPETTVPDVSATETTVPDVSATETTVPDVSVPETTVPPTTRPPAEPGDAPTAADDRLTRVLLEGAVEVPDGLRFEDLDIDEIDGRILDSLLRSRSVREALDGVGVARIVRERDGLVVGHVWLGTIDGEQSELSAGWNVGHCSDHKTSDVVTADRTREAVFVCPSIYDEYVTVAAANIGNDGIAVYAIDASYDALDLLDQTLVAQNSR